MEGAHANPHAADHVALDHDHEHEHEHEQQHEGGGIQFNDSFGSGNAEHRPVGQFPEAVHQDDVGMQRRERKGSKDYSQTDEWDASKTLPSRFQQRKGSIFATPSSRDGHVDRNLEKDAEFHKKHSKRFSFSKVKDKATDMMGGGEGSESRRRRSSAGHSSSG
ncbi:hypothetical protein PG985_003848 [Apiospora marii]